MDKIEEHGDMSPVPHETDVVSVAATLSLERFLRLLLIRESATRSELGRESGLSAASITLRSRWLLEHGLIRKTAERRQHSKRPVEMLTLKAQSWSAMGISIGATGLSADLFSPLGESLWSHQLSIRPGEALQAEVFRGIAEIIQQAREEATGRAAPVEGVFLSLDGVISGSTGAGTIFRLNGGASWVPCQPRSIHPALAGLPVYDQWTASVCKLHGLAKRFRTDDRIGYFRIGERDLHLAVMNEGSVILGHQGTSGSFLHQTVQMNGPDCYCGRTGCLDALLRAGEAEPAQILGAIFRLAEAMRLTTLGLEWPGAPGAIPESQGMTLLRVDDAEAMERSGLALLAVEATLLQQVRAIQARE